MAHVAGTIRIEAPLEQVFDTAADSRNEPSFNPAMTQVELLTPEPVGLGTRFRAGMGKAGMDMIVELTEFDRPHRLGSLTTSSMMETSGTLSFTPDGDAVLMTWDWLVHPKGWFRLLGPLVGPLGRRMERKIWTGLKRQLEDGMVAPSNGRRLASHTDAEREVSMVGRIRTIDFGVNCYLIDVEGGYVLIDTSFPNKRVKLDAELAAAGCGPDDLRLIVLTHGDVDHAGNAAHLRSIHHSPVAIHRQDAEMVRSGDMDAGRKDKPDRHTLAFRFLSWAFALFDKITKTDADVETFEPDVLLEDGQDLSAYGFDARVVHLRGHSSGSIGILTGDGDMFCGDLLVNMIGPSLHYYIDDLAQAHRSIRTLRGLGIKTVYPGHGKPFSLGELRTSGRSGGGVLQ